jgi:REP element-mobilizing transposase RayT
VEGHGFSRAVSVKEGAGFSPCMAHPGRNATATHISASRRTFFITTKTHQSRRVFQVERNVELLLDTLRMLISEKQFCIIDFVIMPDHIHMILELSEGMTIEKNGSIDQGTFFISDEKRFKHEWRNLAERFY